METLEKCNADALEVKKGFFARFGGVVAGAVAAVTVMTGNAFAALDLTGVSVDTADYETIATFLVTALVGFWGIKKGLALLGR